MAFHPRPEKQSVEWLLRGTLTFCALALLLVYWSELTIVPVFYWNAARIYPAFLMAGGISPYGVAGVGPITGWIYGPVMPFLHMPASLSPTITSAMMVSAVINVAAFAGPMLLMMEDVMRRLQFGRWEKVAGIAIFFGFLPAVPVLANFLRCIMADEVAVGLTLLSCWCLARSIHRPDGGGLACAALFAVLAVWTKQIAVIVPMAQLFYLGCFRETRPRLVRYAIWLLGAGAVISGGMILIFGLDPLVFNLWVVPGSHSLRGWTAIAQYAGETAAPTIPCLLLTGLLMRVARQAGVPSFSSTLIGILLTTAAWEIPLNLIGASKVGGGANSLHAVPLIFVTAIIAGIAAAAWWRPRLSPSRLLLVASISALGGAGLLLKNTPFRLTPMPHLEVARIIAEQHPGQIYFPDNPLIVWWTERKVQHYEYGVIDQALAGIPVTKAHYLEYLPRDPRFVVYPSACGGLALQVVPGLKLVNASEIYDFYARPAGWSGH